MPKPLPRVHHVESPFVLRAELLTVVPHSMATIDRLEAKDQSPKRIRLEPTSRVAWLRREVTAYLRHLAKPRQSAAKEAHFKTGNREFVTAGAAPVKSSKHVSKRAASQGLEQM